MNNAPTGRRQWFVVAIGAVVFIAVGATGAWWYMRRSMVDPAASATVRTRAGDDMAGMNMPSDRAPAGMNMPGAADAVDKAATTPLADITITLTKEAIQRAGIEVTPVRTDTTAGTLRLPGVVEANEYRQVAITSLVAGRLTRVAVALGDRVTRGQVVADVYSPELAAAQTQYLNMRAEFGAAHQELQRTERLVEIGAASKQELERIRAQHTVHATGVEGARATLTLFGLGSARIARLRTAADITSTVSVPAPLSGVITKRQANVGLNVDPSTELFTVVDLSTVWVIGALYERDFSRVSVGSTASVTTAAYPGVVLQGKVSYIDPQISPETRTAALRVEVANRDQQLRLGMYADMSVEDRATTGVPIVPRTAVQTLGSRQVVYLAKSTPAGAFVEREVRLGGRTGDDVQVIAGLAPGDTVVSEGTFYLRAEGERRGLRSGAAADPHAAMGMSSTATPSVEPQTASISVGDAAFDPAVVTLRAGVPARLTFTRVSDKTCATEVVLPAHGIKRALPLNQAVAIDFTPQKAGDVAFACGMGMLKGTIVAR
ncbi:MAG TPA: efflux RND transporter periplasmic adaptor subunit [Vicinamibacterales bacterium]|nr:efflux RND transporter periplasmic adaptor subunit [Vicinamibacterales bacterium]